MNQESQNGMECGELELLLTDAAEGHLPAAEMEQIQAHARACPECGPLFAQATAGLRWLKSLREAEPPARLLENILAATTGVIEAPAAQKQGWRERLRLWARPLWEPVTALAHPRLAMTVAMAFFSFTLVTNVAMNATGTTWSDVKRVDLRPASLRDMLVRQYEQTSASVTKYYDNLRFVYELQDRVQALRNAAASGQQQEQEQAPPKPDQKQSERPRDEDESQHYSGPSPFEVHARLEVSKELLNLSSRSRS